MATDNLHQINERVEIRPSPGKGLGVFARVDIPAYTLIMVDNPILRLPWPPRSIKNDETVLKAEIERLSTSQREEFFSLANAPTSKVAQGLTRALCIYSTNCYAVLEGEPPHRCLYLHSSRVNHSCIPNATDYKEATGDAPLLVYSLQDIQKDTEITSNYLQHTTFTTSKIRNDNLRFKYFFTCTCPACMIDTDFGKASDKRREQMAKLQWNGKDCSPPDYSMASRCASPYQNPGCLPVEIPLPASQKLTTEGKMKAAAKLGRLAQEEGLLGSTIAFAYADALGHLTTLTAGWLQRDPTPMTAAKAYVKLRDWEIVIEKHVRVCSLPTQIEWEVLKRDGKEARDQWATVLKEKWHLVDKEWAAAHGLVLPA